MKVTVVEPSWNSTEELAKLLSGTDGPDVVLMNTFTALDVSEHLLPLQELAQLHSIDPARYFSEALLEHTTIGGDWIQIPVEIDFPIVMLNRDYFQASDTPVPSIEEWDWDALISAAHELYKRNPSNVYNTLFSATNIYYQLSLMTSLGGGGLSLEDRIATFSGFLDDEGSVRAMRDISAFIRQSQVNTDIRYDDALSMISSGNAGMFLSNYSNVHSLKEASRESISIYPLPGRDKAYGTFRGGNVTGLTISRNSANPDVAWDFVYRTAMEANTHTAQWLERMDWGTSIPAIESFLAEREASDPLMAARRLKLEASHQLHPGLESVRSE